MGVSFHVFRLLAMRRDFGATTGCRGRNQSGIALVLVLWMLALLSVIAGSMVFSSRTSLLVAGNLQAQAETEALADAGVYKAIYELSRPETDKLRWRGDGLTHLWNFRGATLRVTIVDESAKVDLNVAPPLLVQGLFRSVGVEASEADALTDAVADWRDADDLRRLHGAEKTEYTAAGKDYGPANAPFETIGELRQVLGMNDELFRQLEPLITVHSRRPGINTGVAPRQTLLALPGAIPEQVDAFLEQRRIMLAQGLPAPVLPGSEGFAVGATGAVFSVHVEAFLGDNARFFRDAVVLSGSASRPVAVFAWRAPNSSLGQGGVVPQISN